jgi:hypothetical protein
MKLIYIEFTVYFLLFIFLLYTNTKYAVYFGVFILGLNLFSFFCTSQGIELDFEVVKESEVVYKEYTGDYQKVYEKLSEFHIMKELFKLNEYYQPFGIFYDNPQKVDDVYKSRAVCGIIREKESEKSPNHKEMLEFLFKNGYKLRSLPQAECLKGIYESWFSLKYSYLFIARVIIRIVNCKFFSRMFMPKWKINKIKVARKNYKKKYGVLEIIRSYEIDFFIPVERENQFLL